MRLLRFILIKLTFLLVLGILIGSYFDTGITFPLVLTVMFLIFLEFLFYKDKNKTSPRFRVVFALTTLSIGILAVALASPKNHSNHYSDQEFTGSIVCQIKIREVLTATAFSDRYVAHMESLESKGSSRKVLLSFSLDSTTRKLKVDDELIVLGKLDVINPPLNPHQIDYKSYLKGLGFSHQLRLNTNNFFLKENPSPTLFGISASVRNKIIDKLKQASFGKEELGIT